MRERPRSRQELREDGTDRSGRPVTRIRPQATRTAKSPPRSLGSDMVDTPLVAVRDLRKRYGGVVAVDGMNLAVRRGAIHAVVGENGAGKSTLMKVLAGVVRPDAGEIEIDGRPAELVSPVVARQHGVGIVYQELSLFPQRSVLANLFVNREPLRRGFISIRAMGERKAGLLDRPPFRFFLPFSVS